VLWLVRFVDRREIAMFVKLRRSGAREVAGRGLYSAHRECLSGRLVRGRSIPATAECVMRRLLVFLGVLLCA
jgi:hypothetical protein